MPRSKPKRGGSNDVDSGDSGRGERREESADQWDVVEVGDEAPPYVYEMTAESIPHYCRTVGYENPVYVNDASAREMGYPGVFAPPAMAYTYAPQRRTHLRTAGSRAAPGQARAIPRNTAFVSTEIRYQGVLVLPGDVITSTTSIAGKSKRRGAKLITFRVIAHNQRGETVVEYDCVWLWDRQKKTSTLESS